MTTLYRLTVRTTDGTKYISDYDTSSRANLQRRLFFPGPQKFAVDWSTEDVSLTIRLDQITSVSVEEIDTETAFGEVDIDAEETSEKREFTRTYIDTIHIEGVC